MSSITATSASSGGIVTSDGGLPVVARGVCWSKSFNPTTKGSKTINGSGSGAFGSSIKNLNPGTTYHVRAYAVNKAGVGYGSDRTFTTAVGLPLVITGSATVEGPHSARIEGSAHPNGGQTTIVLEWGSDTGYGHTNGSATVLPVYGDYFHSSRRITGLDPATTYHYRVRARNSAGTAYGEDRTFDTPPAYAYVVQEESTCQDQELPDCYTSIQAAVNEVSTGYRIRIQGGFFDEAVTVDSDKALRFSGGWDPDFSSQRSYSAVNELVVESGRIEAARLILSPKAGASETLIGERDGR